jgi:hypothetical protein
LALEYRIHDVITKKKKKNSRCWALVVHTCNPSYSGGRDQEDCGLKPAGTGGVAQGVGPEFKPQCHRNNK